MQMLLLASLQCELVRLSALARCELVRLVVSIDMLSSVRQSESDFEQ